MLRSTVRRLSAAALLAVAATVLAPDAWAQQSTFTYQGSLLYEGEPYNGTADYLFRLWNAPTGGSQVATPVQRLSVEVQDGLFLAELNFVAEALASDRWLAISVRTPAWDGDGVPPPYVDLPTRQRITASPYSVQTRGIFVNNASNRVGIGTTSPQARLHVAGEVRADDGVVFPNGTMRDFAPFQRSFDFGPVPSNIEAHFAIGGIPVEPGDFVLHSVDVLPNGFVFVGASVESGRIRFTFRNVSSVTLDPPPMHVSFAVFKR